MKNFWTLSADATIKEFRTNAKSGLSSVAVPENRKNFGTNIIEEIKGASALELIIDGIREPMMIVLLAIGGLSLVFGKMAGGGVIGFFDVGHIFGGFFG